MVTSSLWRIELRFGQSAGSWHCPVNSYLAYERKVGFGGTVSGSERPQLRRLHHGSRHRCRRKHLLVGTRVAGAEQLATRAVFRAAQEIAKWLKTDISCLIEHHCYCRWQAAVDDAARCLPVMTMLLRPRWRHGGRIFAITYCGWSVVKPQAARSLTEMRATAK